MMKRLILVAAPPACGKNYVSERICSSLPRVAYLDKDDLADLLRCAFSVGGEAVDMDGEFYLRNLRDKEYETLLKLAFSALRFEDTVLINAPFLKEVRDEGYMRALSARAAAAGAELILVWVCASVETCLERMRGRGSERDERKLAGWEEYVRKTDYSAPARLIEAGAVDRLFVFDNENERAAEASLAAFLRAIREG